MESSTGCSTPRAAPNRLTLVSQPLQVPESPIGSNHYESPPRRNRVWSADRPGDVVSDGQPHGALLGSQGPDQGFALRLARSFDDQLMLAPGEHRDDVVAGCVAVALKRASAFGRAPTVHDLRCAFSIFGFLGQAEPELIDLRRELFEEVSHPHHYAERRAIADGIPTEFLRRPHQRILEDAGEWRSVLSRLVDH